ncbi:RNA helicase [Streptococcus mitis]|uniref:RNA helicase n=1 Tax=Streptococcus mitis TaxID=28037 RepID=A0A428CN76_STRMT|nr:MULTISPECIES: Rep family protein [Streptococcus]RSI79886.1 RNA helicase [Streptococcus mitis]WNS72538.1 Rep family protein [Streptococcus sp. DTU_2020_1001019_1_SI_AUS_MUR_006]
MATKRKEALLTSISITQYFDTTYWKNDWDEELIKSENVEKILEEIVRRASEVATVSEAYVIKHDKDTSIGFDSVTNSTTSKLKEPHIHALLKFSKGATLTDLALKIGLEPQYLEKAKSGRYGYDNLLAYLIHAKDKDKYQYSPDEVFTLKGKDYLEIYHERHLSWLKGKAKKEVKQTYKDIDLLIDNILNGNITKKEMLLNKDYHMLYAVHKSKVNEAFRTIGEIKGTMTQHELENKKFKKTIFFIFGLSGLGKTKFARTLTESLIQLAKLNDQNWQSVLTAGTNMFDEVNGEEILLLDDVRGDSLTASDWLKLLDPYNISPISARYQNRLGASKVIIITSSKHPLSFFYHAKGNTNEDLSQYIRRIAHLVTLRGNSDNVTFHESQPKRTIDRVVKIPGTDQTISLSYDFTPDNEAASKEELLSMLVSTVGLYNQWDLWEYDKSKTPSKTVTSEDEVADNQEK